MRSIAIALPLLVLSACGSCVGDDEKTNTQQSSSTSTTTTTGEGGRGGSRFAKPFVPGQPTAVPEHRDE